MCLDKEFYVAFSLSFSTLKILYSCLWLVLFLMSKSAIILVFVPLCIMHPFSFGCFYGFFLNTGFSSLIMMFLGVIFFTFLKLDIFEFLEFRVKFLLNFKHFWLYFFLYIFFSHSTSPFLKTLS